MTSSSHLKRLIPYLILTAEVVVFYRHVLFLDYVIPWDLRGFHLPHSHLYADALSRGDLPLWDPYTYCGRPFQANIQTAVFYPASVIVAAAGALFGHHRLLFCLELNVILHVLLAGIFAFRLGRAAGLSPPAALLAGTVYQLGGFFAAHAEHMGAVTVAVWLPLALESVLRLSRGFRWRQAVLLAAALALSILGGLTPLTAVVFAACLLFAFLLVVFAGGRPRTLLVVLAACAGSAILAAAQLAPTLELSQLSIGKYRSDWLGTGGGVPLQALVSLVWPNYYDVFNLAAYRQPFELTFMYLYCGALALGLAACAVFRKSSGVNLVFSILLVVSAFLMLGDSTPVGRAAYSVLPVRIKVGLHPEYTMPLFILVLALLAGLGLERATRRASLGWAAACICAVDLIAVSSGRPMNAMPLKAEPGISRTAFDGGPAALSRVRELGRRSFPPARFDTIAGTMSWAMSAPTTEAPTANGNDPLALARLIRVRLAFTRGERWGAYYEVQDLRSPVLGMLNVRILIARRRLTAEQTAGSGFEWREDVPGYSIYENAAAMPRFWLVPRIRHARSEAAAASLIASPGFRPAEEAVVEGDPAMPPGDARAGAVKVREYGFKDVGLEVESPGWRFLVSSESYYPGWRAWLDGVEQPVYLTNVAFRGLVVPPGRHVIRWRFEPQLLWWSGLMSLAGWLGAAILWFATGRAEPVSPGQAGGPLHRG